MGLSTAEKQKRYRDRTRRQRELAKYGFHEGASPSEKVRQAVREAVASGELKVPKEGFDDGSKYPWRPDLTDRTPDEDELKFRRAIRKVRLAKAQEFDIPVSKVPLVRRGLAVNPVGTVETLDDLRAWRAGDPDPHAALADTSHWTCAVCGVRRGGTHKPGCAVKGVVQLGRPPAA